MPNWNEIRNEWETTKITLKALADKHDVKLGTLKSRKSRESWSRDATKKDATKGEKVATSKKRKKQKNRSGNPNPVKQFTKRNSAAVTHGLFSKYINEEQQEIIDQMQSLTIADQIWSQIEIKFSAIIRLQKIMWVGDEHDHLKMESGYSESFEGDSKSYKVAFAYERYESYIKAQARAMAEYRNLVKQYIEITDEFDERRMKLQQMQANVNKIKAETKNEESGENHVVIVNDKEAMRKAIQDDNSS